MNKGENPQTDGLIVVTISYDPKNNRTNMKSDCPTVLLMGILETAKMLVTGAQVKAQIEAEETRKLATQPAPVSAKA